MVRFHTVHRPCGEAPPSSGSRGSQTIAARRSPPLREFCVLSSGEMSTPPSFYRWRPHPWHGLDAGDDAPEVVNAYIEITPFDTIKYEIDKATGYLRVDRPQRGS